MTAPFYSRGVKGDKGDKGVQGDQGNQGIPGPANLITVGDVTTGNAGSNASIILTETSPGEQTLDAVIPRGDKGEKGDKGDKGDPNSLSVNSTTTGNAGSNASVLITGESPNQMIDFVVPRGDRGEQGEQGDQGEHGEHGWSISAGSGSPVDLSPTAPFDGHKRLYIDLDDSTLYQFTGETGDGSWAAVSDVKGEKGDQGTTGLKGDKGDKGDTGNAGAVTDLVVGTVTDTNPGGNAQVTITGTAPSKTINFALPRGAQGTQGIQGEKGEKGDDGEVSAAMLQSAISDALDTLVDGSPGALDTLNELAAAIGNDPNFAATISSSIGQKADKSRKIQAGTGLTGGGDLTDDRTLNVSYGSTANTAAEGNDSRLSDSRTPTDNSVSTAKIQDNAVSTDKIANAAVTKAKTALTVQGSLDKADNSVQKSGSATGVWMGTTLPATGTAGVLYVVTP